MKYSELDNKNVSYIVECIKAVLKRIGVNTRISVNCIINRNGEERIHVESGEVITTPAIFKRIHIEGDGYIVPDEAHPKCFDLHIPLGYRYEHFDGGFNGVEIGTVKFRIINDGFVDIRLRGLLLTAYVEKEF